jgi:hypothetical protein
MKIPSEEINSKAHRNNQEIETPTINQLNKPSHNKVKNNQSPHRNENIDPPSQEPIVKPNQEASKQKSGI